MTEAAYQPISSQTSPEQITSLRQSAIRQTDGAGMRVGKNAEFTLIAPLAKGGAELFRARAEKLQAEAAYWEGRIGTVHNLRVMLVNNDTQILFAASYVNEFKPYVLDVIRFAQPWIDHMFLDVADGFPGLSSPDAIAYINKYQVEAAVWYVAHPDLTVRDVDRAEKVRTLFDELLDAVQS